MYSMTTKIFRRKDITLTRNRVIRIQNTKYPSATYSGLLIGTMCCL